MRLYAADIGRGPDGKWWVLGDRAQAPSGCGYALENRLVVSQAFPDLYAELNAERLAPFFRALAAGLKSAGERAEPRIGILTPGPLSSTYYEQAYLARYLGFLLVEGDDLVDARRAGSSCARSPASSAATCCGGMSTPTGATRSN